VTGSLASYWHPKDRAAVLEFLREDDTLRRLEEALVESPPGAAARELAMAAETLEALRAS